MSWTILDQSVTGETQWFNASYGPALSTVADALVGSITQQTVGAAASTYAGVVGTSSGLGNGAVFTIIVGGGGTVTNITVTTAGSSYAIGDTITIANGDIGGGGTDLIITLIANDFVTTVVVPDNVSVLSAKQNVAGYSAGTISFTIDPAPDAGGGDAWTAGSTLEMTIIGGIDTSSFIVQTLVINEGDTNSTFYVDWAIPLQVVVLQINNNTTPSTGQTITVSAIRMQVETGGGGIGYVSSSGTTTGPGGVTPQIQFNDGGIFNGAAGALYDNTNTQIHLANGTAALPTLAFSDGTFPAGNFDTGIFLQGANVLALSTSGSARAAATSNTTAGGGGVAGFAVNTALSLARLSATPANSWEDGHEGDSTKLWFSPSDFTPSANAGFSTETYNVGCFDTTRGPVRGVAFGGLTSASTALCAMKLIPKGFQIGEGNAFIFTSVSAVSTPALASIAGTELRIYGQVLNTTTGISSPAALVSVPNYTTNAAAALGAGGAVTGDGLTSICIYWDPGQRLQVGAGNRVLLGAYLEMIRI